MADAEGQQRALNLSIPPEMFGGVWSNFAIVKHSEYEFTIDFVRIDIDPSADVNNGIVTSRVNLSPLFVTQLIEALQANWEVYAQKAMPKEVQENDT
jgi:hypothetical protein